MAEKRQHGPWQIVITGDFLAEQSDGVANSGKVFVFQLSIVVQQSLDLLLKFDKVQ